MKKVIFLLFVGLSMSLFAQNDFNKVDKKGYKQGKWKKLYRSGQTYYEGEFKDNYEIGEFLYYYSSGVLKTRNTFSNEGKRCISEGFFESGKPMYKGIYLNKQKDSVWNYFQEKTGKIITEQQYAKGERTGIWYTFNEKGDTVEFTTWKNDKKNGAWYSIYANGYVEGTHKDSKLEGIFKDYYADGKIKEQGNYSNGEKDGGWEYFAEDGTKLRSESWYEGMMGNRILYFIEWTELKPVAMAVSIFDIAYFYKQANNTVIVTSENEKITYDKPFETLQELLGTDHFLLLNQKSMLVVNQNALKEAQYDNKGEVIGVIIEPTPEINIVLDENGQKAVKAFFLPDIED